MVSAGHLLRRVSTTPDNECYSPSTLVTVTSECPLEVMNECPDEFVNLNDFVSLDNQPAGSEVRWHTGTPGDRCQPNNGRPYHGDHR